MLLHTWRRDLSNVVVVYYYNCQDQFVYRFY